MSINLMKSLRFSEFGPPSVLRIEEVPIPEPGDFGQEVRNCLENVGRVLNDAHMNYSDIASVQIYLVDLSQFQEVNAIYKEYFKSPLPAGTTVQVAKLSLGAHIEVSAIARK